jgi:cellulose synthase operon protein C
VLDSLFTELAAVPAIETEPARSTGATPYAMAVDYLSKGLYDRAAAEVSRALLRGADRAEGMTLLGDVFVRQGLYGEALERYRDARRASSSSANGMAPRAMMGEARALIAMGRAAEAAPVAEDLLSSAPQDVEALLLVASARVGAGDVEGALDALDNARQLAPERPDVPQRIGDVNRARHEWVAAMQAYYEALSLDPDLAVVRFELARLLAAAGRDREAEAELVAALDAVPTYVDAGLELAAVWRRTGRPDAALHLLVELLERDLTLIPAMLALGELLFETGRRADAARAFGRLRRLEPGHPAALYYEGALLAEQRQYRDAIERWELVIAADPDGRYARLARRDKRTAADLAQIFSPRARGEALAMSRR